MMTENISLTESKPMAEKPAAPKRKSPTAKAPIVKPASAKVAVVAKPVKKVKKAKKVNLKAETKVKVVRDSFTMPQNDYVKISELKQACLKAGLQVKKSELLRAGLHVLSKLSVAQLKLAISKIEQIKTGRPKKD
jgi:hypothetical protein